MTSQDELIKVDQLLSHRNFINIKGIVQDIKKIEHIKPDGFVLRLAIFVLTDETGEVNCQLRGDIVKILKNDDNILILKGRIDLINKTLLLSLDSGGEAVLLPVLFKILVNPENWNKKDEQDLINISTFSYQYLK